VKTTMTDLSSRPEALQAVALLDEIMLQFSQASGSELFSATFPPVLPLFEEQLLASAGRSKWSMWVVASISLVAGLVGGMVVLVLDRALKGRSKTEPLLADA